MVYLLFNGEVEVDHVDIEYYKQKFNEISVDVYYVEFESDENSKNFCFRDFNNFFSFVKREKIKSVFFNELFINLDIFFINEELLKDIPFNIKEYLKEDIAKINEKSLELTEEIVGSHCLEMRCIYQGQILFFRIIDRNIETTSTGEELLSYLIENIPLGKKNELLQEAEDNKKFELKKLEDFILNDTDFHNSTNLNLRRDYLKSLKEKYPKYQNVLNANDINPYNSMTFIERLWKAYKYK